MLKFPREIVFHRPDCQSGVLVVMLEKHGIAATQEFVETAAPDAGD